MKLLGIDYGDKIIGLAMGDSNGPMVHGHGVLERIEINTDLEEIRQIVEDNNINQIVIGLPKRLDNTIGTKAQEVLEFVELVKQQTGLPVVTWDERLTSVEANRSLQDVNMSHRQKKRHINTVAACIILQSYIDAQKFKDALPPEE